MNDIFADIRLAAKYVAENSQHVFINFQNISAYALELKKTKANKLFYDKEHHYYGDPESLLAYTVILDSINFGSGYFPELKKIKGLSGYYTVATCLKEYFEDFGKPSAEQLLTITKKQVRRIFKQEENIKADELMALFTKALNDLGELLINEYDSSFIKLLEASDNSAQKLMKILLKMPLFQDEYEYLGKTIKIYKRAQITASDLALAFGNKGFGSFFDLDGLTIFADNLLPHVLRVDNILSYSAKLNVRLENREYLDAGSAEEIEIRAVSIHACELIAREMRISSRELDFLLWNRGSKIKYRKTPRHRTKTVFY